MGGDGLVLDTFRGLRSQEKRYLVLDYRISIYLLAFSICFLAESQRTKFGQEMVL